MKPDIEKITKEIQVLVDPYIIVELPINEAEYIAGQTGEYRKLAIYQAARSQLIRANVNQDVIDKFQEHDEWEKEEHQLEGILSQLSSDITNVRIDVATITERLKSVDDSLVTLNHNSSTIAERVGFLEKNSQRTDDFKDFVKKLVATIVGTISVIATIAGILSYFRLT